jgi:hypothetical protein
MVRFNVFRFFKVRSGPRDFQDSTVGAKHRGECSVLSEAFSHITAVVTLRVLDFHCCFGFSFGGSFLADGGGVLG